MRFCANASASRNTAMVEVDVTGKVKFYRLDEGWGFIERPPHEDDFVHARNLKCSAPYAGEELVYDIEKSSAPAHAHEAVNVRRKNAMRRNGDVIEWHVEPGTWESRGRIAPHDGGAPAPFSRQDLLGGPAGSFAKPRPWHGASYAVVETRTGQRGRHRVRHAVSTSAVCVPRKGGRRCAAAQGDGAL